MSEKIVGDLTVGRHIYGGGDVNIPGNATIKRNLKVEGWLEAPNIKGVNKGLFSSEEALNEAYPKPKVGWWALVGNSIPAPIYRAEVVDGGVQWVVTGESGGEASVELNEYVSDAELANELKGYLQEVPEEYVTDEELEAKGYLQEVPEEYVTDEELEAKGYAKQADVEVLNLELSAHKNEVSEAIYRIDNEIAEQREDVNASVALGNNALEVANNAVNTATNAQQKANEALTGVNGINGEITTLKAKNTEQDALIEQAAIAAETAGAKAQTNESSIKQLQTTASNLALVDEMMQGLHKAHNIINLHNFVVGVTIIESSVFPEYMNGVPSMFVQNGLVVMFNTTKGWEAWQLINSVEPNTLTSYNQLIWGNAEVLAELARIEQKDATQDERLATLEQDSVSQGVFNAAIENHINQTENDYIGVSYADGEGTLYERIIALEAKVKELEAYHSPILGDDNTIA